MQENKKSNRFQFPYLNRDFDELQCQTSLDYVLISLFQSLIGILMNCNVPTEAVSIHGLVSIPNRDFDELQSPGC